jgi:hypothetical protein
MGALLPPVRQNDELERAEQDQARDGESSDDEYLDGHSSHLLPAPPASPGRVVAPRAHRPAIGGPSSHQAGKAALVATWGCDVSSSPSGKALRRWCDTRSHVIK